VKAENDLTNAAHTLRLGADCPADTVAFHAQQCVEKYLKALLVLEGISPPKSHDVPMLVGLLPEGLNLPLTPADQRRLTSYATVIRYPGDYEPVTLDEARAAVRTARRVRKEVRGRLPAQALRR
jgi:HEPN domain-containing protein